jgi:rhodanese-related sulfurtransferase
VPLRLLREHRGEQRTHLDQLVLVCRSGMRAGQAEQLLTEIGMSNVHVLFSTRSPCRLHTAVMPASHREGVRTTKEKS